MEVVDRERWHVGKEIPIAVIIMVLGVGLTNFVGWKLFEGKVESYITATNDRFIELHKLIQQREIQIYKMLDEKTKDRIQKSEVIQMFAVKDVQIEALTNSINRLYEASVSNNAVLQEILRNKPSGAN